jgi:hypothetical protein
MGGRVGQDGSSKACPVFSESTRLQHQPERTRTTCPTLPYPTYRPTRPYPTHPTYPATLPSYGFSTICVFIGAERAEQLILLRARRP